MKLGPTLVHGSEPTADDLHLKLLVELLGLTCDFMDAARLDAELGRTADHDGCFMASAATISGWCQEQSEPTAALESLRQQASNLFLYGFSPEPAGSSLAARLSDGAICGVQRFTRPSLSYEVSSSHPVITREFSGLCFGGVRSDIDCAFLCSREIVPLVSIAGRPLWGLVEKHGCTTFLLACRRIADPIEHIEGNLDVRSHFSRLLPAAMFLKAVFGTRCWHTGQRRANFIIDDPPLKPSYGYLNFRDLVTIMDKSDFATTLAFIPWNYRRTTPDTTELFRRRADRLTICVHGCDHTAGEFATADLALANSKVQLASKRMDALRRRTGIGYSKVMVCPQGRFSAAALTALKANNYLASVNSSPVPERSPSPVTVGDCLDPAVTRFGGCPLFSRHYPVGVEQFAFDLFFEKPALVVEHHTYFKDRGKRLAEFIAQLNAIAGLRWGGLNEVITRSHLERDAADDIIICRLFANYHVIDNRAGQEREFVITKSEPGDVPIQNVFVNGQPAEFQLPGSLLRCTVTIPPHASATIEIAYKNILPCAEPDQAVADRARVWARRAASEFRDNVLCRSDLLLAGAKAVTRRLFGPAKYDIAVSRQPRRLSS